MLTPVNQNNLEVFQFPSHTAFHLVPDWVAILFMQVTYIRVTVARVTPPYLALGTLPAAASLCSSIPRVTILHIFQIVLVFFMLSESMLGPSSHTLARKKTHDLLLPQQKQCIA